MSQRPLAGVLAIAFIAVSCQEKRESTPTAASTVELSDMPGTWLGYDNDKGWQAPRDAFMKIEGETILLHSPKFKAFACSDRRSFKLEQEELVLAATENCAAIRYPIKKTGTPAYSLYLTLGGITYAFSKPDVNLMQHAVSSYYRQVEDVPAPFQNYFIPSQDDALLEASVSEAEAWFKTLNFHVAGPEFREGKMVEGAGDAKCWIDALPRYSQPLMWVEWYLPRRQNNRWNLRGSFSEFTTEESFSNSVRFLSNDYGAKVRCMKPLTKGPWTKAELKDLLVPAIFQEP